MPAPTYQPETLQNLLNKIITAVQPSWNTTAEKMQEMLWQLCLLAGSRGVLQVDTLSMLAQIGGNSTNYVIVTGKGIFSFDASAAGPVPASSVLASGGGQWRLLGVLTPAPYERVIGDSTSLSFVVPHNQDTLLPRVEIWDELNPSARTRVASSEYTVTSDGVNKNSITITQTGTTPWASNSKRVIIKAY